MIFSQCRVREARHCGPSSGLLVAFSFLTLKLCITKKHIRRNQNCHGEYIRSKISSFAGGTPSQQKNGRGVNGNISFGRNVKRRLPQNIQMRRRWQVYVTGNFTHRVGSAAQAVHPHFQQEIVRTWRNHTKFTLYSDKRPPSPTPFRFP